MKPGKYKIEAIKPLLEAFMEAHDGSTPSELSGMPWTGIDKAAQFNRIAGLPAHVKSLSQLIKELGFTKKKAQQNKCTITQGVTADHVREAVTHFRATHKGKSPSAGNPTPIESGKLKDIKWMTVHVALCERRISGVPKDVNTLPRFRDWMDGKAVAPTAKPAGRVTAATTQPSLS